VKRRAVAGILAAGALAFAAAGAQGVPTGAKVSATDFEFTEEEVKISKGEKVIWTFDEGKHNVTGKGFKSGSKKTGTFKYTFEKIGTFKYRCTLHQPDMDGVVKVTR
jgi:plastocyanin